MNYFTYFTEVEDHFRKARNSGMFMMSPLDWALVEVWKDGGVPLEAVLKGIDRAFQKYHARRRRASTVNSVAYCAQEVMQAAREMGGARGHPAQAARPGFEPARLAAFFSERAGQLRRICSQGGQGSDVYESAARSLETLAEQADAGDMGDLEEVEERLTVLEDRVFGAVSGALSEDDMLAARRDMAARLKAYRRKLTAGQIALLEQRYLRRKALADLGLSRLSLFHVD